LPPTSNDNPHLLGRDPKDGGEFGLLPHRAAAAGPQGVASGLAVPIAEGGARLDRDAGHAADMELHLDDLVGGRKGALGRRGVAEPGIDENVVGRLVPHDRPSRHQRVLHLGDPRQLLVFDRYRLGRVLRLSRGLRHDHRHRLADMTHLV
jgi:hypothetical protein